ncbi:MAG: RIP metalloprotease RseP [Kordiimonas sp.]|nr:RIP metalloprotease RseP [Kordiimonas sp.]
MDTILTLTQTIFAFVFVLTILVFIHEWGHYYVARRYGVRVEVFSIGFGPEIWGRTDKNGTRWKISAVPLGGYVKFFGDANSASTPDARINHLTQEEKDVSFHYKPLGQRAAIVAAGPMANFIFAILILAGFFMFIGQPYSPAVVGAVMEDSAASEAGLQVNDKIIAIDGETVDRFEDIQRLMAINPGKPVELTLERGAETLSYRIAPKMVEFEDRHGNVQRIARIGVARAGAEYIKRDPFSAIWHAVIETGNIIDASFTGLGQIIVGDRSAKELGGPVKIAKFAGQHAQDGLMALISFMAMISINLGILNVLPIPMLDGGHLLYYGCEAVLGRKLSDKTQEFGFKIGLAMVLALMVFVTVNDIVGLTG